MGRYTYFENGKWRIKVGDTEFAGPWVDKLSYYEELAPNLENTKDEAYNLGYQTCLHAKGLTWSYKPIAQPASQSSGRRSWARRIERGGW